MVAVSILAILIVIFGGILSQVQRVISLSNEAIRIDRTVAALHKLIRRDVSSINKGGFLKITGGNQIAFTVMGSFETRTQPVLTGNAAIIDYGRLAGSGVLWRRLCVLTPGEPNEFYPGDYGEDGDPYSMARRDTLKGEHYDALLDNAVEAKDDNDDYVYATEAAIKLPPRVTEHWADYVTGDCTEFKVFWWNGATSEWSAEGATGSWSAANPDNWPEAVRIRFRLEDKVFEVIAKIE